MTVLKGKRIVIFDLEIKKTIEQCSKGWQSYDEMGISCLCMFDYFTGRYRVFDDYNKDEAVRILCTYDLVVGFNTIGFDWKVVQAEWIKSSDNLAILAARQSKDYDILAAIWSSIGGFSKGYKLDDVAFDSIGVRKSGDGALAPKLYQAGRLADVIDYCINDVLIEKTLFEFVINNGFINRAGKTVQLELPKIT